MKDKREYTSFLDDDTNVGESQEAVRNTKKSTVLSRQTTLIVILAAFIVVMIPVYIFFVIPMLDQGSTSVPTTSTPKFETKYEEVLLNKGSSIGMRETFLEKELDSVIMKNKVNVKNDEGSYVSQYKEWTIFKGVSGSWAIEGYEKHSYDASSLITILAYLIRMEATDKLEFSSWDEIDLSAYGFDEASMPTRYTIKTTDGKEYTVTIGSVTPTNSGYYAYYTDENGKNRPTVYIIGTYFGQIANCSMYDLIAPTVIQQLDQKDYVPETFSVYKGKNLYFNIKKFDEKELAESESGKVSHLYITIDGVEYEYDASADYSVMLYEQFQPGINGTKVVYAKPDADEFMSNDMLLSFGIDTDNPYRQLFFKSKAVFATGSSHMLDQMLVFSEKTLNENEDEVYYVFNVLYNTIVEVKASLVSFIEYDYTKYCEKYIVLYPFYNIDEITVDSSTLPEAYVSEGMKSILETFIIKATDDYKLADAIIKSTGKTVPTVSAQRTGLKNFGEWYSILLSLSTQTEIPSGVLDKIDLEKPDITITMKTIGGNTHVMRFYLYNSRHAYYTFDGLGRAYVKYDDIANMLDSTYKLINGKMVNSGYTAAPEPTDDDLPSTGTPTTSTPSNQQGMTTTEIALIVVLCIVVVAGGGAVAYVVLKGKKSKAGGNKGK